MMPEPKKYHLSEVEIKNVKFRRTLMDYLSDLINNDMGRYIYSDVRPRLNLPPDVKVELSDDGEWLSEVIEDAKIIKP